MWRRQNMIENTESDTNVCMYVISLVVGAILELAFTWKQLNLASNQLTDNQTRIIIKRLIFEIKPKQLKFHIIK